MQSFVQDSELAALSSSRRPEPSHQPRAIHGFTISHAAVSLSASPVQLASLDAALIQFRASVMDRSGDDPPTRTALDGSGAIQSAAAHGVSGSGGAYPHSDTIQKSFGRFDIGGVTAHTGQRAVQATRAMGAEAYATNERVAFGTAPSLHTAAHEAAHVVQQRGGVRLKSGVGRVGDQYERHADAVADLVVQGKSAEALLAKHAGPARLSGTRPSLQLKPASDQASGGTTGQAADRTKGVIQTVPLWEGVGNDPSKHVKVKDARISSVVSALSIQTNKCYSLVGPDGKTLRLCRVTYDKKAYYAESKYLHVQARHSTKETLATHAPGTMVRVKKGAAVALDTDSSQSFSNDADDLICQVIQASIEVVGLGYRAAKVVYRRGTLAKRFQLKYLLVEPRYLEQAGSDKKLKNAADKNIKSSYVGNYAVPAKKALVSLQSGSGKGGSTDDTGKKHSIFGDAHGAQIVAFLTKGTKANDPRNLLNKEIQQDTYLFHILDGKSAGKKVGVQVGGEDTLWKIANPAQAASLMKLVALYQSFPHHFVSMFLAGKSGKTPSKKDVAGFSKGAYGLMSLEVSETYDALAKYIGRLGEEQQRLLQGSSTSVQVAAWLSGLLKGLPPISAATLTKVSVAKNAFDRAKAKHGLEPSSTVINEAYRQFVLECAALMKTHSDFFQKWRSGGKKAVKILKIANEIGIIAASIIAGNKVAGVIKGAGMLSSLARAVIMMVVALGTEIVLRGASSLVSKGATGKIGFGKGKGPLPQRLASWFTQRSGLIKMLRQPGTSMSHQFCPPSFAIPFYIPFRGVPVPAYCEPGFQVTLEFSRTDSGTIAVSGTAAVSVKGGFGRKGKITAGMELELSGSAGVAIDGSTWAQLPTEIARELAKGAREVIAAAKALKLVGANNAFAANVEAYLLGKTAPSGAVTVLELSGGGALTGQAAVGKNNANVGTPGRKDAVGISASAGADYFHRQLKRRGVSNTSTELSRNMSLGDALKFYGKKSDKKGQGKDGVAKDLAKKIIPIPNVVISLGESAQISMSWTFQSIQGDLNWDNNGSYLSEDLALSFTLRPDVLKHDKWQKMVTRWENQDIDKKVMNNKGVQAIAKHLSPAGKRHLFKPSWIYQLWKARKKMKRLTEHFETLQGQKTLNHGLPITLTFTRYSTMDGGNWKVMYKRLNVARFGGGGIPKRRHKRGGGGAKYAVTLIDQMGTDSVSYVKQRFMTDQLGGVLVKTGKNGKKKRVRRPYWKGFIKAQHDQIKELFGNMMKQPARFRGDYDPVLNATGYNAQLTALEDVFLSQLTLRKDDRLTKRTIAIKDAVRAGDLAKARKLVDGAKGPQDAKKMLDIAANMNLEKTQKFFKGLVGQGVTSAGHLHLTFESLKSKLEAEMWSATKRQGIPPSVVHAHQRMVNSFVVDKGALALLKALKNADLATKLRGTLPSGYVAAQWQMLLTAAQYGNLPLACQAFVGMLHPVVAKTVMTWYGQKRFADVTKQMMKP